MTSSVRRSAASSRRREAGMNLSLEIERQIRGAILAGASDEDIAGAVGVSVKIVRPIRQAVEAARRPK